SQAIATVLARDPVDPRGAVVGCDQAPCRPPSVGPVNPVIQGVEPEPRLLLGLLAYVPSQLRDFRRPRHSGLELWRCQGVPVGGRFWSSFRSGMVIQADLLAPEGSHSSAGVLGSTGVTPLRGYYDPLRLPTGPPRGYAFPRRVVPTTRPSSGHPAGPP